jgi:N-acetyl sugar amidotransferase
MTRPYQVCTRCVMDISAHDITFDASGVCSYCAEFLARSGDVLRIAPDERRKRMDAFVMRIKEQGRGKRYDCIIGVSGGVDSSWVLVQAVERGLRPLAVHMDNGWNSELAQNNISNLIRTLGVDLFTHVIEWQEYRRLMEAFFRANVVDVELLYDNAMIAVNYRLAERFGIRAILAGTNQATEGMRMPRAWNWLKHDARQIRAIASRFGAGPLRTFPAIGTTGFVWAEVVRKVRWHSFLDLLDYRKSKALDRLERDFGYKRYPYKHYESVFTRFYQGYLLPTKFGVDKRRVHLSTLVVTGQMTREQAIAGMQGIAYPSTVALGRDVRYFLKKMRWTQGDLDAYLAAAPVAHDAYPSERPLWESLSAVHRRLGRFLGAR